MPRKHNPICAVRDGERLVPMATAIKNRAHKMFGTVPTRQTICNWLADGVPIRDHKTNTRFRVHLPVIKRMNRNYTSEEAMDRFEEQCRELGYDERYYKTVPAPAAKRAR
jgi:alpha-L-fucosidase